MAHEIKTEVRTLLAAARRGDFSALLALADYWQENTHERASEFSLSNWNRVVGQARRMSRPDWHKRHPRLSPLDNTARFFRDFARLTSQLHGNCWRIGRHVYRNSTTWEWCKDMAHALLKHVKAARAAGGDGV